MIKLKYHNKIPTKTQKEEINVYVHNKDFIRVLLLTKRYYVQDYSGDYEFLLELKDNIKFISVYIY